MIQLMNLSFISQPWPLLHHLNCQTLWFIKVQEIDCGNLKDDVKDYGHLIPAGMTYIKGIFLERIELNITPRLKLARNAHFSTNLYLYWNY